MTASGFERQGKIESGLRAREWFVRWAAPVVTLMCIAVALLVWRALRNSERRAVQRLVASQSGSAAYEVSLRLQTYAANLTQMAARWKFDGDLERIRWESDAQLMVASDTAIQALEWIDPSGHVRWIEPLSGNEPALGFDLTSESRRRAALEESRATGKPVFSKTIDLVQGGKGVLLFAPVPASGNPTGWVLGVFRVNVLFDRVLSRQVAAHCGVAVFEGADEIFRRQGFDTRWEAEFGQDTRVEAAGVSWRVRAWPDTVLRELLLSPDPDLLGAAGVALSLLLGFLVQALLARREINRVLRESEEMLDETGRLARIGGWSLDVGSGKLKWTRETYAVHEVDEGFVPTVEAAINFYTPESRPVIRQAVERAVGQGEAFDLELEIVTARGRRLWVHAIGRATFDGGATRTVSGTFQDITERKRTDDVREAVYRLSEATTSARSLDELFVRAREILSTLVPTRNFYVALMDTETGTLHFPYFVDEADPPPAPRPAGRGLTEYVIRTGEPLLASAGVFDDLAARGEAVVHGTRPVEWLGAPLKASGETIGAVVVQTYSAGVRFTASDKDFLSFISSQLATAIVRKRAEEALRESEDRYRDLVENTRDLINTHDLEGRILSENRAAAKALGYDEGSLVGQNIRDILAPEFKQHFDTYLETIRRDGIASGLMTVQTKAGKKRVWEYHNSVRTEGVPEPIVRGIAHDVTERWQAEQALRESEERFRQIAGTIHDAFWAANADPLTRIFYISPAYERIWGRSVASLYENPRSFLDAVHPDDRERVLANLDVQGSGQPFAHEYRILRPDGTERWIWDSGFPVREPTGEVRRYVGIARDITERRQLEEQLRQAQRMEAIGRLAGGIAHEFNNLLTVILGNGDLLRRTVDRDFDARESLSELLKAAERATTLTQQLLAFGRRQMLRPTVLRLETVLAETEEMLRHLVGENVELVVERAGDLLPVKADRSQIEQVILNLALNARDAMPRGGKLTFSLAVADLDEPLATFPDTVPPGRWVTLEARDTGHGMDAETMAHIFEPFFTTKAFGAGSGLGLATVHGIVEQSGGHIEVESAVGQGTRFRIFFSPAEGRVPSDAVPASMPEEGRETVLLVEDEESVRRLLAKQLTAAGYSVLVAADAEEALRLAGRRETPVNFLVTDMVMPGMDGAELAKRLGEVHPGLKVLLVSGYMPDRETARLAAASGWRFLPKPFTGSMLLEAMSGRV